MSSLPGLAEESLCGIGKGVGELTVLHEGFTDVATRDSHEAGWAGALAKLAARVELAHEEEET